MASRHFPVRPNLDQLKHQAKDLLRALRRSEPQALADLREYLPQKIDLSTIKLADAQYVLAQAYGLPHWTRLVQACRMTDAIWRNDIETVRVLVLRHPHLLHEDARGVKSNWGPPLSYAANIGRNEIIEMLLSLGATDLPFALQRACLQSQVETARHLQRKMGNPPPPDGSLNGPAYTLSVSGTELLLEFGARVSDESGKCLAPVEVVLGTDSRNPTAKHRILEIYVEHGLKLPDTPTMALHRGRLDLLEAHLHRDPRLLSRTFSFAEIYPPELGHLDEVTATHGTPLTGATLLHLCADYDEIEIARWLLSRGMNVDAPAAIDADGFGGHTALFATVVSQPNFWINHHGREDFQAPFTKLLLDHGANPNARASLRKQLHPGYGIDGVHLYRDVTPLRWGAEFVFQKLVSRVAMRLIEEYGGHP